MLKKLMKRKARRPYCSVKNCTRDQWNKVGIHNKTFYRLPSAPFYKERWLDVCQIDPNDTRVVKVCDRHFTVHDLKLNKTTDGKDRTRMLLKHFAIPSLNLPPPPLNLEDISVPGKCLNFLAKFLGALFPVIFFLFDRKALLTWFSQEQLISCSCSTKKSNIYQLKAADHQSADALKYIRQMARAKEAAVYIMLSCPCFFQRTS